MELFRLVDRIVGMGRPSRIHFPGAVYHAMARGVDGQDVFIDDHDRTAFLDGLRRIEYETFAEAIAYCLMGNHFHFAIKVGQVALAVVMQRILTSYVMRFNLRHDRTGHLFQARYKAILCLDDRYLSGLIRYIHMNPVRAGLVSAPQDWPWSSYKCGKGGSEDLLDFDPWPKRASLTRGPDVEKVDLAVIGSAVAIQAGICVDELRSRARNRPLVVARRLLAREAVVNGHSLIAVAKWLNMTLSSVSRYSRDNTAIR